MSCSALYSLFSCNFNFNCVAVFTVVVIEVVLNVDFTTTSVLHCAIEEGGCEVSVCLYDA
jgi:hypothetical protein